MESVTIMASLTFGTCNLWQELLMASVIMANVTEPVYLVMMSTLVMMSKLLSIIYEGGRGR